MNKILHITQIKMPLSHTKENLIKKACQKARIKQSDLLGFEIGKQSIDARRKEDIHYLYAVYLTVPGSVKIKKGNPEVSLYEKKEYRLPESGDKSLDMRPAVIGCGPGGLFCAYLLALKGYRPLIFERGEKVEDRAEDVKRFWETGILDTHSNVQFGEGGAGTFSDGKLNTAVKDKYGRNRFVLETFVKFGAPQDILYVNKPHIGTDILIRVVRNMRIAIEKLGGEFHFSSCVTDFKIENSCLTGITVNGKEQYQTQAVVLACGHSARDTFETLYQKQVPMEAKAFAAGFRVEHSQDMINLSQYKTTDRSCLPAADYKVTYRATNGRSVYSFCMCPGGYVVNASSEEGRTAVNGMSYRDRGSANANSAIIVSVTPKDYGSDHPLAGMEFQRRLEEKAFALGQGRIPQQLFGDFEKGRKTLAYGQVRGCEKGETVFADLTGILPVEMKEAFCEGMHAFDRKVKGFACPDTILSAVESRTSSPVRILRGDNFESRIRGLYPCGEGAGYAGGITSAAMDGMKTAEALIKKYKPINEQNGR